MEVLNLLAKNQFYQNCSKVSPKILKILKNPNQPKTKIPKKIKFSIFLESAATLLGPNLVILFISIDPSRSIFVLANLIRRC